VASQPGARPGRATGTARAESTVDTVPAKVYVAGGPPAVTGRLRSCPSKAENLAWVARAFPAVKAQPATPANAAETGATAQTARVARKDCRANAARGANPVRKVLPVLA